MARFIRRITKKLLIATNIVVVILFLIACCNGFLNPAKYWWVAILGVGISFLIVLLLFFVFVWWIFKSRWIFLSLVVLLIGWPQINKLIAFHPFSSFKPSKPAQSIRIMQWNVDLLDQVKFDRPRGNYRLKMFDFIRQQDPDILCMEEFLQSYNLVKYPENIQYISQHLNYPYYYFVKDYKWGFIQCEAGVVIFSRYPIVDTFSLHYNNMLVKGKGESIIHADINVNGTIVRVFATHLQSLHFKGQDYTVIHSLAHAEPDAVDKSKGVIRKFRGAYGFRSIQAEIVRRELDASPYPAILCGDFNDVPNSYTYSTIKGDLNDAFLRRGFGIGRTFAFLSPTLRIDYILADKKLEVLQFRKTVLPYSDHYPLVTDLKLPSKQ